MAEVTQAAPGAEVLSFPNIPHIDGQLLERVLHNMSRGVLLFDSETRLIFCNRGYLKMYGLLPEIARPGRYLRDLLAQRIQTGTFTEDPDEYIVRLKESIEAGTSSNYTIQLPDGRSFSVSNKPITGGGWLDTRTSRSACARKAVSLTWRAMTRLPICQIACCFAKRSSMSSNASSAANA
jgi:PAS domain-containing protein